MDKKEQQQFIDDLIGFFGTTIISAKALQRALPAIISRLPVRLVPFFPFLLLALEIAKLLYKHRKEIRDTIGPLTKQVSNEVRKGTDGIADIFSPLPKKIGRKLSRWSAYLPVALEIAKASYEKIVKKLVISQLHFQARLKRKLVG
ncbi:hypothetical protein F4X10_00570 [Candidatus Poribacteria bacterium]|nr:hypothetical protein [Candidatus Poribacteria bacterium]